MRETEDELTRDVLAAGATVINATQGGNGDTPTEISELDVSDVTSRLRNQNARTISDNILGEDRYGTYPVRDAFFSLSHSRMIKDLNAMEGFTNKAAYGNANMGLPSEEGTYGNVRFLVSSNGYSETEASLSDATVYSNFIVGQEAYAVVQQDGYTSSFLYGKPQPPLFMNATVGWKMAYAARVTSDQFMANLKCTLS